MSEEKTAEGTEEKNEAPKTEEVKASPPSITIVNVNGSADGTKKLETTLTFTLDWTDDETGERRVGTFTAVRPNIGMTQQIAVLKARYNGGEAVTRDIDFLNEMMAYLDVCLTDVPKWWAPQTFYTATPLRMVWDHVSGWDRSFRQRSAKK